MLFAHTVIAVVYSCCSKTCYYPIPLVGKCISSFERHTHSLNPKEQITSGAYAEAIWCIVTWRVGRPTTHCLQFEPFSQICTHVNHLVLVYHASVSYHKDCTSSHPPSKHFIGETMPDTKSAARLLLLYINYNPYTLPHTNATSRNAFS